MNRYLNTPGIPGLLQKSTNLSSVKKILNVPNDEDKVHYAVLCAESGGNDGWLSALPVN